MPKNSAIGSAICPATLPLLFEQQAARTPHAPAVSFHDQTLSYRVLNRRANQLAHYLARCGASPGALVAIGVERSLETLIAILAILKTGAAYVPLDPAYPKDRLAWMLADCRAPVLITAAAVSDRFSGYQGAVLCLERERAAILREEHSNPPGPGQPADRAYVMYTSGSAGWPKGVEIAHASVVNAAIAMRGKIGMTARDVVLSVSSPSFDIHVLDVWMPLTSGASMVIASPEACRDGIELASAIRGASATAMQATPSTWQLLLDSGWTGSRHLNAVCGGETLSSALAGRLGEKVKTLWNAYGPTETTVWSSVYRVLRHEDIVPIGRPLANTQFHVLDEHRRPALAGTAGELYIGGSGLALGYLNQPELTAQSFVPHPFDRAAGRFLYRTGDRVRQRPDGNFEFLGRLDRRIKLRGYRIELDEIDSVLRRCEGVRDAAATLSEQDGGYKHLAAYVVAAGPASVRPEQLRAFLRATLPEYMVPTRLTYLESLPRLPNGKLDYRGLGALAHEPDSRKRPPQPCDETESRLACIFEEVLGRGPIDTGQSFFDLGGDSILVARLLRRVEDTLGSRLPMAALFRASTIRQLAQYLREQPCMPMPRGVIPIHAAGAGLPFLCLGAGPSFLPLARLVGGGFRFLGLDLGLIDPTQLPFPCRLEDLAAQVAQRISELEPAGPYHLGGWCRYGPLAYETARQLRAQGSDVTLLALIDSANPQHYRNLSLHDGAAMIVQRLQFHFSRLSQSGSAAMPRYLAGRFRVLRHHIRWRTSRVNSAAEGLERILHRASAAYEPAPYEGAVAFFQSAERPRGPHWDLHTGWLAAIRGRVRVYDIPGDHESMLREPQVQLFAGFLRGCLLRERHYEAEAG